MNALTNMPYDHSSIVIHYEQCPPHISSLLIDDLFATVTQRLFSIKFYFFGASTLFIFKKKKTLNHIFYS